MQRIWRSREIEIRENVRLSVSRSRAGDLAIGCFSWTLRTWCWNGVDDNCFCRFIHRIIHSNLLVTVLAWDKPRINCCLIIINRMKASINNHIPPIGFNVIYIEISNRQYDDPANESLQDPQPRKYPPFPRRVSKIAKRRSQGNRPTSSTISTDSSQQQSHFK